MGGRAKCDPNVKWNQKNKLIEKKNLRESLRVIRRIDKGRGGINDIMQYPCKKNLLFKNIITIID